ncbi:MAG: SDR family oxidoreductase, partial [Hyphomicrobiales bacterium]|nr:SDR family oxidoreductase [Hyphomicrobiales bacterium]
MAEHWQQGPVLITGGTGLVGRAIAAAFAGTGAVTVAVGSDAERTRKAAAVFAADSLPIHAICADMSDPAEINRVFEAVELQHGTVAVLVNAAGINFNRMIADVGVEDFDRLFRTNVRAAFFSSRTACERMIAASLAGRVVNITSGNYRYARPDAALYAATKSALEMLTRGFALEYGE